MSIPASTRLRYFKCSDIEILCNFVSNLQQRIQIYSVVLKDNVWHLIFVPDDALENAVMSLDLDNLPEEQLRGALPL